MRTGRFTIVRTALPTQVDVPSGLGARRAARPPFILIGGVAAALALVAILSPSPSHITDRGLYETIARQRIVPECDDLHCFRVLVPVALGVLPGSSIVKWKTYAVLCSAATTLAVWYLCVTLGLRRRAAAFGALMSAFGFGSLYTLYDTYTADPLMFLMGPLVTNELLLGRVGVAAAAATLGVFAKEFAAAPVYIFSAYLATWRRWMAALRVLVAANAAFIVWAAMTLILMLRFGYAWSGAYSGGLTSGGALPWFHKMTGRVVLLAMFSEFGALYVLTPVGLCFAPPALRRLALVSIPVAALFAYGQQPDRALWNFHFLVTPLAAIVLDRVPAMLAWSTIAAFSVGNLRLGAQLPIATVSRPAVAASIVLALASCAVATRARSGRTTVDAKDLYRPRSMTRRLGAALATEGILIIVVAIVAAELFAHKRAQELDGVNIWGYRGQALRHKRANEVRVAVLGGDLAFGSGVAASETLAASIGLFAAKPIVEQSGEPATAVTTVNLGARGLAPHEYAGWTAHFAYLQPDVLCLEVDPETHAMVEPPLPNRRSVLFRKFGYSPTLAPLARIDRALAPDQRATTAHSYLESIEAAVAIGLPTAAGGVIVVLPPQRDDVTNEPVKRMLSARFPGDPRLRIVDLNDDPRMHAHPIAPNGFDFSVAGQRQAAQDVVPSVLALTGAIKSRGNGR